jgi:threonyl-tRNA synthetase
MKKIIKSGQKFERKAYDSVEDARLEYLQEPFKLELVDDKSRGDIPDGDASVEVGEGELTAYSNVNPRTGEVEWYDLCRGPHVPTTRYIPAFALTRTSAAYWRGDQSKAGLQRIYGTAWESKEALDAYQTRIAEAEKRDHRRLGQELDLFSFPDEIGSGFPVFHPDGAIVRFEMEEHSRRAGTSPAATPSSTPRTSPRVTCSRSPGTSTGTPTACSRP